MSLLCAARCATERREAAPGYRLCWICRDWLRRNLAELVALAPDLEAALSRTNITDQEKVGGSRGGSVELNELAARVRWQINHDMVTTVRIVVEERGLHGYPRSDIADMARWLGRHTDWLAAHGSAGERANEAADWVNEAKRGINPNPPKRVEIGPCPLGCTGVLTAVIRPQDSMLPSAIVCSWWYGLTEDGRTQHLEEGGRAHTWRADEWHALGRQVARLSA